MSPQPIAASMVYFYILFVMFKKLLLLCIMAFVTNFSFAQATKIFSKSPCNANVTVNFFNGTVVPSFQSVTVSVPAFSTVPVSCGTCTGPGWNVCSALVNFTTGASIAIPGPACPGSGSESGAGQCFTSMLWGYSNGFWYAFQP